jgi:hypothetical protein
MKADDLSRVVRELEQHAAAAGWDRPAELYALVSTDDLLAREPGLAEVLNDAVGLTPVQQDELPGDDLEAFLQQILWPPEVAGSAAVVERLMLPPAAEEGLPDDPAEAASYAAQHPDRQDVRIVAAVTRDGRSWCAIRNRAADTTEGVLVGPDLVPGLVELLRATLEDPGE